MQQLVTIVGAVSSLNAPRRQIDFHVVGKCILQKNECRGNRHYTGHTWGIIMITTTYGGVLPLQAMLVCTLAYTFYKGRYTFSVYYTYKPHPLAMEYERFEGVTIL